MIKKIKDVHTVCIHGTLLKHEKTIGNNYYFDSSGKRNDIGYTKEFAQLLGSDPDKSLFIRWSGDNSKQARIEASNKIYSHILSLGKGVKVNLIGHSHGGNIMIMVANLLKEHKEIEVVNLITLATPVREYKLTYKINHIQLFSYFDIVQNVGFIDVDRIVRIIAIVFLSFFLALPCIFWPKHTMKGAHNINVDGALFRTPTIRKTVKNGTRIGIIYQHQSLMFISFIKKVFKEKGIS